MRRAPDRGRSASRAALRRSLPALDGRQKVLKLVRRIGHLCDMREVDPGEDPEKIERRIGRRFGQDHRHDREGRIAGLTDKGEFAFVLLGVAEPARPDQHDHRLGCADGLFQRREPRVDPAQDCGDQRTASGPSRAGPNRSPPRGASPRASS